MTKAKQQVGRVAGASQIQSKHPQRSDSTRDGRMAMNQKPWSPKGVMFDPRLNAMVATCCTGEGGRLKCKECTTGPSDQACALHVPLCCHYRTLPRTQ